MTFTRNYYEATTGQPFDTEQERLDWEYERALEREDFDRWVARREDVLGLNFNQGSEFDDEE